jgi:hypothetical protein
LTRLGHDVGTDQSLECRRVRRRNTPKQCRTVISNALSQVLDEVKPIADRETVEYVER